MSEHDDPPRPDAAPPDAAPPDAAPPDAAPPDAVRPDGEPAPVGEAGREPGGEAGRGPGAAVDPVLDPELGDVAERVRRVLQSGEMRPEFRSRLRAELVAGRAAAVAAAPVPARGAGPEAAPGVDGGGAPVLLRRRRPGTVVWAGAAAAAAVGLAAGLVYGLPGRQAPGPVSVAAVSDSAGRISVDPAAPLRLRFSQPLNHAATEAALRLTPAAAIRSSWHGDTLEVAALHGFAPNSAYVLSVDHSVARTASGAALAGDVRMLFGTAPAPGIGPAPAAPVPLPRSVVAGAAAESEAVVTTDGSLLLTNATTGGRSGLLRVTGGTAHTVAAATDAICVSRTGESVAFLAADSSGTSVVFADSSGAPRRRVPVVADPGSPLGWIDDTEVSYVAAGRLQAVDRAGHVRLLSPVPVDTHDSIAISPGGRYVYLGHGSAPGRLVDLHSGQSHVLTGSSGSVAFSADGGTVVWVDGSAGAPRLATAPSAGGPVLTAPLPVRPGDQVGDLAVSPDGSRLAYSVTRSDGRSELRLASLPDGDTLAVSAAGAGGSPNWAPSGQRFTVLAHAAGGARIETVDVPSAAADAGAAAEATVAAFANAQLSGDTGAQGALGGRGLAPPRLPQVTRAAVLTVQPGPGGTATAQVRFTQDPRPDHPAASQLTETLTLRQRTGRPPVVEAAAAGPVRPAPAGPQLVHLDTDATPGAVTLTFDSDLDPAGVGAAVQLTTPDGAAVSSTVHYVGATRSVTVRPAQPASAVVVRVGTGLRDVAGRSLATPLQLSAALGG